MERELLSLLGDEGDQDGDMKEFLEFMLDDAVDKQISESQPAKEIEESSLMARWVWL